MLGRSSFLICPLWPASTSGLRQLNELRPLFFSPAERGHRPFLRRLRRNLTVRSRQIQLSCVPFLFSTSPFYSLLLLNCR